MGDRQWWRKSVIRWSPGGGPRVAKDERRTRVVEGAGKTLLEGSRVPEQ